MARFGGHDFTNFSLPLVFEGRYFLVEQEPDDPPQVTVVLEKGGQPLFEVLKNKPVDNAVTSVLLTAPGIITVTDRQTGRFLYSIGLASAISITFGTLDSSETSLHITDREILLGTYRTFRMPNHPFARQMTGLIADAYGNLSMGGTIPRPVLAWLTT